MICSVTKRERDDIEIIELRGRFTLTDATGVIWSAVSDSLAAGRRYILLDLTGVTYLDSAAGIGELVRSYTSALRHGGQVKLLHVGKNVDNVLRIVGLHNVLESFDDEDAAVRSFDALRQSVGAS